MNTLATFFASILALIASFFGYTSTAPTQQPVSTITASSTISTSTITATVSPLSEKQMEALIFAAREEHAPHVKHVTIDGTISSGTLAGYTRVAVRAQSDDWAEPMNDSGDIVFMFATKDFKTYIVDTPFEYYYLSNGNGSSTFTKNVTATGTVPSNFPETIELGSFVLEKKSNHLEAVSTTSKEVPSSIPGIQLYLDSTDIIAKDSFGVMFNYILLPKETYEAQVKQPDFNKPGYRDFYFTDSDIKTDKPLYKTYGNAIPGTCSFGVVGLNNGITTTAELQGTQLQKIGVTTYGTAIYTPAKTDDTINKKEYTSKITSVTELYKNYGNLSDAEATTRGLKEFAEINKSSPVPTFENYVAKNPILFMKDPWGRWVAVGEWDYNLEGGCGKPVIYLYPTKDTTVSVKLDVPTTFTTQIPTYSNGWDVLAHADGTLTDLQPEATECSHIDTTKAGSEYAGDACKAKTYPYLYWSGNVAASYPAVDGGWIVEKHDVAKFLNKILTDIGFTSQERTDFTSYWVPQLLIRKESAFRISFITTQAMNSFIPMSVTPRPDSVYRLFMDWEPLSQAPDKEPAAQTLPKIHRNGFTLVEWGGVHPK